MQYPGTNNISKFKFQISKKASTIFLVQQMYITVRYDRRPPAEIGLSYLDGLCRPIGRAAHQLNKFKKSLNQSILPHTYNMYIHTYIHIYIHTAHLRV